MLEAIAPTQAEHIMLGFETNDDAAVVRLTKDLAILQTVDFFTPIVDDAYDFGRIAAANALSDIYAMGGDPLCAMNLLAFPCSLAPEIVADIVRGGAAVCTEAGAPVVGGHTVDDEEPKFGLSVTGRVEPDQILYNSGALPGDVLVLTKPLGTGLIGTALKRGVLEESDANARAAIESMARLNREASHAAQALRATGEPAHACTDVSGFGLAGHAHEMAQASDCAVRLRTEGLPLLAGAAELAAGGVMPGKTEELIEWVAGFMIDATAHDESDRQVYTRLVCDPQASGGLLLALTPSAAEIYRASVADAWIVGDFLDGPAGQVTLV